MCGRYTIAKPERVVVVFKPDKVTADLTKPRYNIAPMQKVPVLAVRGNERVLADCQWGLVPGWAGDPSIGSRMINARAETVAVKPSFRDAFRHSRCLIPADGFYEWRQTGSGKQPVYVRADDNGMFAFAGLLSSWNRAGAEPLSSCVIITTEADALMRPTHDRMPVILPEASWDRWIDPAQTDEAALQQMLRAPRVQKMRLIAVSTRVNSVANDDPACIEEVG